MAFGIFSKNKNNQQNDDSGKVASLFKKIRLNVNQTSGKTINRDFNSEPSFGQVNQNFASIDPSQQNANQNLNSQDQFASAFSDPGFTNIVPPQNIQSQQEPQSSLYDNNQVQGLSQPKTQGQQEKTIYAVGPSERELKKHDYYTYKANEAYLNEEGRDSGHLYIAPGEPLRPRKPKQEAKKEEKTPVQTDLFSNNTMVQGDLSAHMSSDAQENSQNTVSVKDNKTNVNNNVQANSPTEPNVTVENNISAQNLAEPSFENTATQNTLDDNNLNQQAGFTNNQTQNIAGNTAQSSIFANVKNTNLNFGSHTTQSQEHVFNQNVQTQPNLPNQQQVQNQNVPSDNQTKVNNGISAFVYVLVFIRQLVASFFNFTNLGALFPKQSLSILGPSAPAFMPLPYFVIGFVTCMLAMFMQTVCQSGSFCAAVAALVFFAITGSGAFRGIGHLCTAISLRKIDTYGKILITLFVISLFARSIQYYTKYMEIDFYFCLGFAVVFMLSSFTATTLNFGSSDDPVSSFGTLGLKGLIADAVICLAITFVVLDWQIALTMLGICLLSRVLIGQFMLVKGIKASTDMVCALQLITAILLMLEIIFTNGYFTFVNPVLLGQ